MKLLAVFAMVGLLSAVPCLGQGEAGPSTDAQKQTQTLQALLVEMRAMHNDVRLSQTSQILLAEMLMQRGVVDKAMQKRDDLRNRVSQIQSNEKNFAAQIAQMEDTAKTTIDAVQLKRIADQEPMMKANLANFKTQEQDAANALLDADTALRREQEALDNIQAQLDAMVKQMQPAARP